MKSRLLSLLVVSLVSVWILPEPAAAAGAVATFSAKYGVLTITGTPGRDSVALDCSAGMVSFTGKVTMAKAVGCNKVKLLIMKGFDGNDRLDAGTTSGYVSLTSTKIAGGAGNDTLTGTFGNDTVVGGAGDDDITGNPGNDVLKGGPGNDQLKEEGFTAGAGDTMTLTDTTFDSNTGSDLISTFENAFLLGTTDDDTIDASGFSGSSNLWGDQGADVLTGGANNDYLQGAGGNDTLSGGGGYDGFLPAGGDDTIDGGPGVDHNMYLPGIGGTVTVSDSAVTGIAGQVDFDSMTGIEQVQVYGGASSAMTLNASAATSVSVAFTGGSGNDTLTGGGANDFLTGQGGQDTIAGGGGSDTIGGFFDQDMTLGASSLAVGAGADSDTFSSIEAAILWGGDSANTLDATGFGGNVLISGFGGNDEITGSAHDDKLNGMGGSDVIKGLAGDDRIDGGSGSNSCSGGPGNDTLKNC